MVVEKIQYGDNGKIAREKINGIIDEVYANRPSIGDNGNWYIWGVDTGIKAKAPTVKEGDNLLKTTNNDERYTDLQFADNLTPTSPFPVWITVGYVSSSNGRIQSGLLINANTWVTYGRLLYSENGEILFDGWLGVFKAISTTEHVADAISALREELHTVAFTGKSSDLDNDYWFTADPLVTQEEYDNTPGTSSDGKQYNIYDTVEV